MKKHLVLILLSLTLFMCCENPKSSTNPNEILIESSTELQQKKTKQLDSVEFFLTDTITRKFWFNKFELEFFRNGSYKFHFNFWGGYQANEKGIYFMKGDSLILVPSIVNTKRILLFKTKLKESDFYSKSEFLKTKFLKVHRLNIDINENN